MRFQSLWIDPVVSVQDGVDARAQIIVRQADDGGGMHAVKLLQRAFDFGRIDIGPAHQDHVSATVRQKNETVRIDGAYVPERFPVR